jgi:hypothetical protein
MHKEGGANGYEIYTQLYWGGTILLFLNPALGQKSKYLGNGKNTQEISI